jgi:hypothetical protein
MLQPALDKTAMTSCRNEGTRAFAGASALAT